MRIAVYGSSAISQDKEISEKAYKIGQEIAKRGHALVTGGGLGLPYESVLGAHDEGGEVIGVSPAIDIESHAFGYELMPQGFSEILFAGKIFPFPDNEGASMKFRNILSAAISDAAIFVAGRIGTLNEFTIMYDLGRNCGILHGSGGSLEHMIPDVLEKAKKDSESKIIYEADPATLVEKIVKCTNPQIETERALAQLRESLSR